MKQNNGQSLIELLVVIALMAIILPALMGSFMMSHEGKPQQERRMAAAQQTQEIKEAMRSIREKGWDNIATNGIYHPTHNGTEWSLQPGAFTLNGLTSQVEISDVQRDNNHQIVTSGGSLDLSTKKVTITVSWSTPLISSSTSEFYLTRHLDNATYVQTTGGCPGCDFDTGTHTDTIVTNDSGGEVTLGSGGAGNWCGPELTIAALDLPKQGVANTITAIEGEAFVGTGDNASGVSLADVTIANTNPPSASIYGTFDGYKTKDVFGENNYFYVATHRPNREVVIVNIASLPFTEVGAYNAPPGIEDAARSIYVQGNTGYVTINNGLYIFDVTNKSSPQGRGSVTLAGIGESLVVSGNYAYVAISGNTSTEMQIINVSNPNSPSVVGQANVNGSSGKDIVINETATRAYLVTNNSTTQPELFIINIESKNGNQPVVSSYDASGMDPKGVTLVPGNKVIIVGHGAEEYQVINIATESSPSRCGGLNIDTGVNGIASVLEADGDAYSYILSGDTSAEFRIIAGGPGGGYTTSGIYESATFDVGYSTAFNRFIPTSIIPVGTTLQYQIAIVDAAGGSCAGATYVFTGPDGTTGSYYTTNEVIAFNNDGTGYENPARCFRYRAYLETTNSSATPIFEEVTVNYSP